MKPVTLGLIVGNRGFFPGHLCKTGRAEVLKALQEAGFKVVALNTKETEYGSIESLEDAEKCAKLFAANAGAIDGILVTLPNFGDERAVANAIKWSALKVPVLVQAFPDAPGKMTLADRRDSFCGKMSVCNNLRQYNVPFSLTTLHTVAPGDETFLKDLARFAAVCRILRGLKNLRVGALGARPQAFNTVRYSEKMLQNYGVTVETLDLYELMGSVGKLLDKDLKVKKKLAALKGYTEIHEVPEAALLKMAKLAVAIDDWIKANRLNATAVQCWTAMEQYFGIVPCACMSMLSNALLPSGCEVDVMGAVAMYILIQASGRPSALVDWNNNCGDDPDKAVVFHCSNLPKDLFSSAVMDYQEIIAGAVGKENSYGTIVGRLKAQPFTYLRVSTDDTAGVMRAYVGEGEFTDDKLETFGGYGVCKVPNLQKLLRHICEHGYEHHVAVNPAETADAVEEALTKYLGWQVYRHS
ncbi:MAG: fucose isomerase [Planctomycetota bacterium]